ncbi:hypothetical protein DW083_21745 [Parabacteroides sp. AF48-14]|nr:hypothetical protein DW083_21745 [Parabacteroides sp. AF48-14]
MYYETNCTEITAEQWSELMRNNRKCSYKRLIGKLKRYLSELYDSLCLQYPNPYDGQCWQTKTHYILVHSAIEYFINKQ